MFLTTVVSVMSMSALNGLRGVDVEHVADQQVGVAASKSARKWGAGSMSRLLWGALGAVGSPDQRGNGEAILKGVKAYSLPILFPELSARQFNDASDYPRLWTITPRAFRSWPPIASTRRRTHRMFPEVIFAISRS
jgi:hypothetical protein